MDEILSKHRDALLSGAGRIETPDDEPVVVKPSESLQPAAEAGLRELTAADDARWDALVAGSPQGNAFLRSDWLRMLIETSADQLDVFRVGVFNARNELRGGWAVPYRVRAGLRLSYGFDFFYSGPMLAADPVRSVKRGMGDRQKVLTDLARGVADRTASVVLEAHPNLEDARPFLYERWIVAPEYTHLWDLSEPDALWDGVNREKRREIRRTQANCRIGREATTPANFAEFMRLYRESMAKFSWYPTPDWEAILLERIRWMEARDGCRLYIVRDSTGGMMAAVLVLLSREDQTGYYWRMAYSPAGRQAAVVPGLYWQTAMELRAEQLGVRFINLGGSPQAMLSQFKDYMGATPTVHYRLIHRNETARLRLLQALDSGRDSARRMLGASNSLRSVYRLFR
jgi:hypothetical protein